MITAFCLSDATEEEDDEEEEGEKVNERMDTYKSINSSSIFPIQGD